MNAARQNATGPNGFLNLYKPVGITSMDALRQVKRATGQRKRVGHAGTIDPLAEGVLPICFGQATRLMERVVSGRKRYRMTVRLGATSNTYDAEGDITEQVGHVDVTRRQIASALVDFVGRIEQIPPMFSAIKVNGRRLYDLARAGQEIERAPRPVDVYSIRIDGIDLPNLRLTVDCGRGTYLRSIAHDLGQALGCGGYVAQLARLSCGQFTAADSVSLDQLHDAAAAGIWETHLHPVDWALRQHPPLVISADDEEKIRNGQGVPADPTQGHKSGCDTRRAYNEPGVFLALVQYRQESGAWQPTRVFHNDNPSPYAPATHPGTY